MAVASRLNESRQQMLSAIEERRLTFPILVDEAIVELRRAAEEDPDIRADAPHETGVALFPHGLQRSPVPGWITIATANSTYSSAPI